MSRAEVLHRDLARLHIGRRHRFWRHLGWEIIAPLMNRASPLRTTHLRDPYGPPILFGSESFIDELAAATQTDPVDFLLRYLQNPRDRDVVRVAAEAYGTTVAAQRPEG